MAARNELPVVESALRSLDRIDYPAERIELVFVDDGSSDGTDVLFARWVENRPRRRAVTIPRNGRQAGGKSSALAAGVAASPDTDLIAIIDADFEVVPDALARLVAGFSDPEVGAVSGYLQPRNATYSIVARYAALESWLHQLVTSAAKDRLRLDPPTLGMWMVRRDVLEAVGGFPSCLTGEDVQVAAAIARRGFRTRFISSVVASNAVATTLAEYWWQHLRWARDVYAAERSGMREPRRVIHAAPAHARDCPPSPAAPPQNPDTPHERCIRFARRIERLLSATGYADRLGFVSAIALTVLGSLPAWILLGYVSATVLEIAVAIRRGGDRRAGETRRMLAAAATMILVDVAATAVATIQTVAGTRRFWRRPERRPETLDR
jgi:GT2 family glycosyltransferase